MAQLQPTSAEWANALRECVTSRSLHVLHERALLVFVDPRETFHPLHALLQTQCNNDDGDRDNTCSFIAVMQLHDSVVALLRELQSANAPHNERDTARTRQKVLEHLVFVTRDVDATSAKRAHSTGNAHAVPFFCPRELNLRSGALCAIAPDEASARAVLAAITLAVQMSEPLIGLNDDDALTIVVEHGNGGYIAQQFAHRVVASVTRVARRTFEPADTTLDRVLETYERDFVGQLELADATALDASQQQQQQQLVVRVCAGFHIAAPTTQTRARSRLGATLLASWSGIENVQSLGASPPPSSTSCVCIGDVDIGRSSRDRNANNDAALHGSSIAAAAALPFPLRVERSIELLTKLEQSAQDATFEWPRSSDALTSPQDAAQSRLVAALQQFLRDPDGVSTATDSTPDVTGDANTTLELSIALRATRDDEIDDAPSRTDRDVLERLWGFALEHVTSAAAATTLVRELIALCSTARTLPLVHAANPTRLAALLTSRTESLRTDSIAAIANATTVVSSLETELSSAQGALLALAELGEWTLQRDVASWLAHIGFAGAESARVVKQLAVRASAGNDAVESHARRHATTQRLVDVCAFARTLGIAGPLLRKLAGDCLEANSVAYRQSGLAEPHAPVVVVPLNTFIPERIRANLGDALFWDLRISLGDLMQRTVRVCDASFHVTCAAVLVDSALALDSRTLAQLEQLLPTEALQRLAAQALMQRRTKSRKDGFVASGLVLLESTTRRLAAQR